MTNVEYLKEIRELRQRVLDEQAAFDRMEGLYIRERQTSRVLEESMEITQESIERTSINFNLALDETEKRVKELRKMLEEVLFQFYGLVQFVSEDDYIDDELEALFMNFLKDAWKVLRWKS